MRRKKAGSLPAPSAIFDLDRRQILSFSPGKLLPILLGISIFCIPFLRFLWDLWSQTVFFTAALAALFLYLWNFALSKNRQPPSFPPALGLFCFFLLISSFRSTHTECLKSYLLSFFSALALYVLSQNLETPSKDLILKCWGFSSVIFSVLYWSMKVVSINILSRNDHLSETIEFFLNENAVASYFLLSLGAAYSFKDRKDSLFRIFLAAGLLGLLGSNSLGGYLAGILAAIFMAVNLRFSEFKSFKKGWILAGIAVILLRVFMLPGFINAASVTNRMAWWKIALRLIGESPILGHGPGAYEISSVPLRGHGMRSIYAHSFLLQIASEVGIPAAVSLAVFILMEIRRSKSSPLIFGAVAAGLQSFVDFSLNVPGIFVLLFALLGLSRRPEPFDKMIGK